MELIHLRSDLGHMCRAFARTDDERRNLRGFVLYCLELAMGFRNLYAERFHHQPHGFDAADLADKTRFSAEDLTFDHVARVCDGREVGMDVQNFQTEVENMIPGGDRDALITERDAVRLEKEALALQIQGMQVAEANGTLFAHADKDARITRLEADLEAARTEWEVMVRELAAAQEADRNGKRELERMRLQQAADRGVSEEMVLLRRIMQAVTTGGVAPAAAGGGGDGGVTEAMNRLQQDLDKARLDLMEERNAKEDAQRAGGDKDTEIARLNQLVAANEAELQRLRGGGGDVAALQAQIEALLEMDSMRTGGNGFTGMARWCDARIDAVGACDPLLVPVSLQASIVNVVELGYAYGVLSAVADTCANLGKGDCPELDVVVSDRVGPLCRNGILQCVRSIEGTADPSSYHQKINSLRKIYSAGLNNEYKLEKRNGEWTRGGLGRPGRATMLYLLDSQYYFLSTTLPLIYANVGGIAYIVDEVGYAIGLLNINNVDAFRGVILGVVARVKEWYGNVEALMPKDAANDVLSYFPSRVFADDAALGAFGEYDLGLSDVVQCRLLLGCTLRMAPADSDKCFPAFKDLDRLAVFNTLTEGLCNIQRRFKTMGLVPCSKGHLASIGVTDASILLLLNAVDP